MFIITGGAVPEEPSWKNMRQQFADKTIPVFTCAPSPRPGPGNTEGIFSTIFDSLPELPKFNSFFCFSNKRT